MAKFATPQAVTLPLVACVIAVTVNATQVRRSKRSSASPSAAVSVQGALKTYNDTGDSGKTVYRRFCPNCGSGVVAEAEALPGVTLLLAGTLDDPSSYKPVMELYCSSAQPWTNEASERKRFDKMPS